MHWRKLILLTILFLAASSFAATQPPAQREPGKAPADQVTDEDRKFEGTWAVVSEVIKGKPTDRQGLADVSWIFTGKRYVIKNRSMVINGIEIVEEGIQHLNPTKQPKEMEEEITSGTAKGRRDYALYQIDGDACTIYLGTARKESLGKSHCLLGLMT